MIYFILSIAIVAQNPLFQVEPLADVDDVVWGMEFLNPNQLMFTERKGTVKLLDLTTKKIESIAGVTNAAVDGQGGLLDIKKDPNFATNKTLYFCYSVTTEKDLMTTELGRALWDSDKKVLNNWTTLFRASPAKKTNIHFGCRIAFDRENALWLTVGERNNRDEAQIKTNHLGKTLKFTDVTQAPEIYSFGHRNPQGLAVHPETGDVWVNEHGPRGGDEINLIKKNVNYGWPVITYGREYWGPSIGEGSARPGMEQPKKYFLPSIAPSSLMIYSGKAFKNWKGDFFSGALVLQHLNRVRFDKALNPIEEERLLVNLNERIRNVVEGPEGFIYLSTDSGKILRLKPPA